MSRGDLQKALGLRGRENFTDPGTNGRKGDMSDIGETIDVRLRDVIEADLPIFFEHQIDPDANRMADFPARDRDAFMTHWAKIMRDETVTLKTILFGGRVAGNLVCFKWSGKWEVGYWIGKEYWGQGIATRALSAFLDLVKTRPLQAGVAQHNIASIRVLEKCGFRISREESGGSDAAGERSSHVLLKLES